MVRAILQALRLTLRGESLTPAHYRPLEAWIDAALPLLARAERAAATADLDAASLQLWLDGRPTSLEITLKMLRHNLTEEYPRLIRLNDPHSMTVVQSSNMNDQYRVSQFAAADIFSRTALRRSLEDLNAHLLNLPSTETPHSGA